MLDISERDESAGETALRFGCKYHLSGLLRSQACTDITGEIATLRLKKNKKRDKISLKQSTCKNDVCLRKRLSYPDECFCSVRLEGRPDLAAGSCSQTRAEEDDVWISTLLDADVVGTWLKRSRNFLTVNDTQTENVVTLFSPLKLILKGARDYLIKKFKTIC